MGTIVNTAAVLIGGSLGLLLKKGIPKRIEESVMKMLGLAVFIIGLNGVIVSMIKADPATGVLSDSGGLLLILSLVLGVTAGELLRIEDRLDGLGMKLERRFQSEGFSKGFISASLIFCVGAMSIIGSLNDGLRGDSSVLFIKSALDGVCALVLASTLGVGVLFSAVAVLVYQGSITLLAGVIAPLVSGELLGWICMTGYAIVLCIGINFLHFTKIKVGNLLPALIVPVAWYYIRMLFMMFV